MTFAINFIINVIEKIDKRQGSTGAPPFCEALSAIDPEPRRYPHSGASVSHRIYQGQKRRPRQTPATLHYRIMSPSPNKLTQGLPTILSKAEMIMPAPAAAGLALGPQA